MTFKVGEVEKDIPLTLPGRFMDYKKYPWSKMEVGDSIEITFTDKKVKDSKRFVSIRSGIISQFRKYINKNHNGTWNFATRKTEKGFRIWRTK